MTHCLGLVSISRCHGNRWLENGKLEKSDLGAEGPRWQARTLVHRQRIKKKKQQKLILLCDIKIFCFRSPVTGGHFQEENPRGS